MRLIDADALHAKIYEDSERSYGAEANIAQVLLRIETAPTIEAKPMRYGRWIKAKHKKLSKSAEKQIAFLRETYDPTTDLYAHRYKCSYCQQDAFMPDEVKDEFCKHCGAKMDLRTPTEVELDIVDSVMMGGADNG